MDIKALKRLSKQMSWALRHAAHEVGLVVDPDGYVLIDDLLPCLQRDLPWATRTSLEQVVATVETDKQRFSIDGDWIRANYGHSLDRQIEYPQGEPPAVLYHGTSEAALGEVMRAGLLPMSRQYVHLTTDRRLATRVGARHGKPVVLRVDTKAAIRDGIVFFQANPVFWLVAALPAMYLAGES
ncbi:RNA 2'-phosphotransferase [Nitrogeniibacter aestuarii]|uniref:RNA 2'-phosphotransferase n=1 Tax=Nitrogeniibacter aestuarii TaxID=2815343 RepID=UPI001E4CE08C|nr:RNA 2'-phosphotransferase [Nitrogeniibacter aestuarii]